MKEPDASQPSDDLPASNWKRPLPAPHPPLRFSPGSILASAIARRQREVAAVSRQASELFSAHLERDAAFRKLLAKMAEQNLRSRLQVMGKVWSDVAEGFRAPNWPPDADVYELISIMEGGIPLVWIPPAQVIDDLVSADAETRSEVLVASRDAVLRSCRDRLGEVAGPNLAHCVKLLVESVDVAEHGSWGAAQALAASVWDTLIRGLARNSVELQKPSRRGPRFEYPHFRDQLPRFSDDTLLSRVRSVCVLEPIHSALTAFHGGVVPEVYSRHATAHATSPRQYTVANSLIAMMLAVSLIREIEETGWACTIEDDESPDSDEPAL
ncbi:hypothetical protein [Streptomyces sp. NPDC006551]|uniref:hypothetical protein n=1 Tax=Streptomyces sp. NPDC006551 TaxID=3157178 RepID=UPI0033B9662E